MTDPLPPPKFWDAAEIETARRTLRHVAALLRDSEAIKKVRAIDPVRLLEMEWRDREQRRTQPPPPQP